MDNGIKNNFRKVHALMATVHNHTVDYLKLYNQLLMKLCFLPVIETDFPGLFLSQFMIQESKKPFRKYAEK